MMTIEDQLYFKMGSKILGGARLYPDMAGGRCYICFIVFVQDAPRISRRIFFDDRIAKPKELLRIHRTLTEFTFNRGDWIAAHAANLLISKLLLGL